MKGRALVVAVPWAWLALFFLIPFLIVLKISFADTEFLSQPPYGPLVTWVTDHTLAIRLNLDNYLSILKEPLYREAFVSSLQTASVSTLACLLIGYPMALGLARAPRHWRPVLLLLVVLPFWTSFLLRVYAWMGLLNQHGLINEALLALHLIREPLVMLETKFAMYVGIVYAYLPFMILPLYANLEKQDPALLEAAVDLGARPSRAFWRITLPLSMPGVVAGSLLVFIPAVGEFVIPRLLGGANSLMIGRLLWDEYFLNRSWPRASAVAVLLLLILVLPIAIFQHYQGKRAPA